MKILLIKLLINTDNCVYSKTKVAELFKTICIPLSYSNKRLVLNNPYCDQNSSIETKVIQLENNTLYILCYLMNTVLKIKNIVKENSGKNIVFKTNNNIVKRFIHNNPLEKIVNTNGVLALYISNIDNNLFETIYVDLDIDDYIYIFLTILPKPFFNTFSKTIVFIKFTIVGLTGFLINLLTLYVSTNIYSKTTSYEYATMYGSITSFEVSLLWNFILHEYWTFRDRRLEHSKIHLIIRWFKYHISSTSSFLSQVFFITLLSGYLKQPLFLSLIIGILIGLVLNYVFSSKFAWRK